VRMHGDGSTHRYIERMTSRVRYEGPVVEAGHELAQPADFICVDSGLEYFGDSVQITGCSATRKLNDLAHSSKSTSNAQRHSSTTVASCLAASR